ncbi:Retrovirus-related pol Polyprotein [Phytophthora palmivora]|uniref:Retrovirus-related pol Polyprotein n=1 Tax=Phytophthora palmivora TaxID=4796 RepID=A0A2P4X3Y4_9STRA|nr:Retrovirus-related pol Polyprotein [Phytophthora palmivora]
MENWRESQGINLVPYAPDGKWTSNEVKIPRTFREAMRSEQKEEWKMAMENEMQVLRKRGVLAAIEELPDGEHAIDTKWVYDVKVDESGYVTRFRARIVAKESKQVPGMDFILTHSP